MLRGSRVGLRTQRAGDGPALQELYDDVATTMRADSRPWRPVPAFPHASTDQLREPADDAAFFSVIDLSDEERLVGEALLWSIDLHNRTAHLGISLLPAARGRGLGTDVVRVLSYYGFAVRGLHRLQVDTLRENAAMVRAASTVGFVQEGVLRRSAWVDGEFLDEVVLGLLAGEWRPDGAMPGTGAS